MSSNVPFPSFLSLLQLWRAGPADVKAPPKGTGAETEKGGMDKAFIG